MEFVEEDLFRLAPDYNQNEMYNTAKNGIRELLEEEDQMNNDD
jgi:hypothetical protein